VFIRVAAETLGNTIAAIAAPVAAAGDESMSAKLCLALAAAPMAVLIAVPALAADPETDAPTATAAQPGVAAQIEAFLRDSPAAQSPADAQRLQPEPDAGPRKVHGVVEVGVGSHGYRSVYMRSDIPVGQSGMVSIAVGDSRGGYPGYGYGYGYGRRFVPGLPLEPVDAPPR
jgi:hypothetical protein